MYIYTIDLDCFLATCSTFKVNSVLSCRRNERLIRIILTHSSIRTAVVGILEYAKNSIRRNDREDWRIYKSSHSRTRTRIIPCRRRRRESALTRETERQTGRDRKFVYRQSRRPNPPEKRSLNVLWSRGGLSAVERQAFPKHRGTRPTPGGGRQQVTTEQTYTNNSRERFYSLSLSLLYLFFPLYFSLFLCLSSTFVTVEQPVVRRRQSIYRPSAETRSYVEHTWEWNVRGTNMCIYVRTLRCGGENGRARVDLVPYVGCGRPRMPVHPSFVPFEGLPSIAELLLSCEKRARYLYCASRTVKHISRLTLNHFSNPFPVCILAVQSSPRMIVISVWFS